MVETTMVKLLPKVFHLYIDGEINEGSANSFVREINSKIEEVNDIIEGNNIYLESKGINSSVVAHRKVDLIIHVSTYGGSVYDGLRIIDTLKDIDKNDLFNTLIVCEGKVMSCGIPIILSVKNRVSTPNTTFMIHQIRDMCFGPLESHKENVNEMERLQTIIDEQIVSNTKITSGQLEEWYKHRADTFLSAQQAMELGLINNIIS